MECPRCSGEMQEFSTEASVVLGRCPECGSLWIDSGDLTRALLHHNLPGLDSLGGRENLGETAGMCPEDLTDLTVVDSSGAQDRSYALCEVCGGVWLTEKGDGEGFDAEDGEALLGQLVEFFRDFAPAAKARA